MHFAIRNHTSKMLRMHFLTLIIFTAAAIECGMLDDSLRAAEFIPLGFLGSDQTVFSARRPQRSLKMEQWLLGRRPVHYGTSKRIPLDP